VTLVGQSAGAHLCALALLYQSQRCVCAWSALRKPTAPVLTAAPLPRGAASKAT